MAQECGRAPKVPSESLDGASDPDRESPEGSGARGVPHRPPRGRECATDAKAVARVR